MSKLGQISAQDIALDVLDVESKSLGIGGVARHVSKNPAPKKVAPHKSSIKHTDNSITLSPQRSSLLHSKARGSSKPNIIGSVAEAPKDLGSQVKLKVKKKSRSQGKNKVRAQRSGQRIKAARPNVAPGSAKLKAGPKVATEARPGSVQKAPDQQVQVEKLNVAVKTPLAQPKKARSIGLEKLMQEPARKSTPSLAAEAAASSRQNPSSTALRGLHYAARFNHHMSSNHKRSLSRDLEKESIFERNALSEVQKEAHSSYTKKVRRRAKMIGGIEHHNIGRLESLKRRFSYRPARILVGLSLALLVAGYVAYLNLPSAKFKMAANSAGISASEPSYTPEGYSLSSPYVAEAGKVSLKYTNNSDPSKSYSVVQESSNWDSQALLENKVSKESQSYSTFTDRGLTIYVYDGKAVWVNQGKLNQVQGDSSSSLETADIVRIAGSM